MWDDMKDFFLFMLVIAIFLLFLITLITLPVAYFDGKAKTAYLKQYRGIELPWYQSIFLSVEINDAKIEAEIAR